MAQKTLEDEADAGVEELKVLHEALRKAMVHRRLQESLYAEVERLCQSAYSHGSSTSMVC